MHVFRATIEGILLHFAVVGEIDALQVGARFHRVALHHFRARHNHELFDAVVASNDVLFEALDGLEFHTLHGGGNEDERFDFLHPVLGVDHAVFGCEFGVLVFDKNAFEVRSSLGKAHDLVVAKRNDVAAEIDLLHVLGGGRGEE